MSTIKHPSGMNQDVNVYNGHATVAINIHDAVSFEGAATSLKLTINPYAAIPGPLEGTTTVPIIACEQAPASAGPCVGVALSRIPISEWGIVRAVGYTRVNVHDATTDAHGTSYGRAAGAAGRLAEVAAATAVASAGQIGTSGTTVAGDPRNVFVDCRIQMIANLGLMPWA